MNCVKSWVNALTLTWIKTNGLRTHWLWMLEHIRWLWCEWSCTVLFTHKFVHFHFLWGRFSLSSSSEVLCYSYFISVFFLQKGDSDSHKKFPSKSCPLRYGTTKIQEDALTLFHAGLRDFLGFSKTHGSENNWGITALSVSASKIVPIPSVSLNCLDY
jgi:hypothetical protein